MIKLLRLIIRKKNKVKTIKVVQGIKFDNGFIDDNGIFHPIKGKEKIKIPSTDSEEFKYALWIKETFGGDIHMVPEIGTEKGAIKSASISTPDYIWNNEKWDLKGIDGNSRNTIGHKFDSYKHQTDNLIIFARNTLMNNKKIIKYIYIAFYLYQKYYNKVIFVRNFKVIKIFEKND